jgi:hypothetical protein
MIARTAVALATLLATGAFAQAPARPDPADPKSAAAARPAYESAFKGYRPYKETDAGRWRESNEEMGRLKGHVGHVPGSTTPSPLPASKSGHGAHHK